MTDGFLKLLGLDSDDLAVISAHVQDAIFKTGDMAYVDGQFSLVLSRFVWEKTEKIRDKKFERRRAVLNFKRVRAVRSLGIDRKKTDDVHVILSIQYEEGVEPPAGYIEIVLAGNASVLMEVECIEVMLGDSGAAWETKFRPKHP